MDPTRLDAPTLLAFPTTGIIDTGNRADEFPLSDGGKWSNPLLTGSAQLQLVSRLIQTVGAGPTWDGFRNDLNLTDLELYSKIAGVAPDSSCDYIFYFRFSGANGNGYSFDIRIRNHAPTLDEWRFFPYSAGVRGSQIGSSVFQNIALGDVVGILVVGSSFKAYLNGTQVASVTDSTYASAGRVGVSLSSGSPAIALGDGSTYVLGGGAYIAAGAAVRQAAYHQAMQRSAR